jgi:hypothetical protein
MSRLCPVVGSSVRLSANSLCRRSASDRSMGLGSIEPSAGRAGHVQALISGMRVSARRRPVATPGVGSARTGAADPPCRRVGPAARVVDSAANGAAKDRNEHLEAVTDLSGG